MAMTMEEYLEEHGLDHDDGEPIRAIIERDSAFELTFDYMGSWPDKLLDFIEANKRADWMEEFCEAFRDYADKPSPNGPLFWRWARS